jgi:hypothetical protein
MRTFQSLILVSVVALGAASCRSQQETPEAAGPVPVGTVREVMHGIVEYNAFKIFNSVAITITAEGTTEKEPRTEEEWDEVLHAALALSEASNLLTTPGQGGRAIAKPDEMDTARGEGELTPTQIQVKIDANRELWLKHLSELQNVGRETMDLVNAKSVSGLFEIGEKIDRVCETCHMEFWYPEE